MHKVSIWYVTICDEHPVGFSFALFLLNVFLPFEEHLWLNAKEFVVQTATNNEEGIAHRFQWKCSFAWFKRAHMTRLWPAKGKKNLIHLSVVWKALKRWRWAFFGSAFLFRQHHNHVRAHVKHKHKHKQMAWYN